MPQLISRKLIFGYFIVFISVIIVALCGISGMKKIGNLTFKNPVLIEQQKEFETAKTEAQKQYKRSVTLLFGFALLSIMASTLLITPVFKRMNSSIKSTTAKACRLSQSLLNSLPPERVGQNEFEYLEFILDNLKNNFQRTSEEIKQARDRCTGQEDLASIGKLAGKVGHELRNPLGAIKNSIYYLNMTLNKEEQDIKEILEVINQEIGRADKIVGDLLDYSRIKPPSFKNVIVADLLKNIVKNLNISSNIQVVENHEPGTKTLEADPDQLFSAFSNIISNAVAAMPDGGTLEISSKTHSRGVMISVRDSGSGISDEDKLKIFEPFFTTRQGMLGLGLAMAKKHINAHKGIIEIKSKEGEGSQFDIFLPEA